MLKKLFAVPLVFAALLLLGAGCAKQTATFITSEEVYTGTYQSGEASVAIANFAFSPAVLGVEKGTKVEWTNLDNVMHRVALDTGVGSLEMKKNDKWSFTFNTPGKYTYHCAIHPSMVGTIYVK